MDRWQQALVLSAPLRSSRCRRIPVARLKGRSWQEADKCVVEASNRLLEILASETADDKRLAALRYVVRLVADVHQHFHAGYREGRGGNAWVGPNTSRPTWTWC